MDSRRPLYLRIAVSYYFFACGCVFATWASRIPTLKELYGWNEAQLGSLLFLLPLGSFVALPFAGWAITRFGSKRMTVLATLGYAWLLGLLGYNAT
ncbi:MAG: MFS transporter, partial [Chitinophagaceae bacterium]